MVVGAVAAALLALRLLARRRVRVLARVVEVDDAILDVRFYAVIHRAHKDVLDHLGRARRRRPRPRLRRRQLDVPGRRGGLETRLELLLLLLLLLPSRRGALRPRQRESRLRLFIDPDLDVARDVPGPRAHSHGRELFEREMPVAVRVFAAKKRLQRVPAAVLLAMMSSRTSTRPSPFLSSLRNNDASDASTTPPDGSGDGSATTTAPGATSARPTSSSSSSSSSGSLDGVVAARPPPPLREDGEDGIRTGGRLASRIASSFSAASATFARSSRSARRSVATRSSDAFASSSLASALALARASSFRSPAIDVSNLAMRSIESPPLSTAPTAFVTSVCTALARTTALDALDGRLGVRDASSNASFRRVISAFASSSDASTRIACVSSALTCARNDRSAGFERAALAVATDASSRAAAATAASIRHNRLQCVSSFVNPAISPSSVVLFSLNSTSDACRSLLSLRRSSDSRVASSARRSACFARRSLAATLSRALSASSALCNTPPSREPGASSGPNASCARNDAFSRFKRAMSSFNTRGSTQSSHRTRSSTSTGRSSISARVGRGGVLEGVTSARVASTARSFKIFASLLTSDTYTSFSTSRVRRRRAAACASADGGGVGGGVRGGGGATAASASSSDDASSLAPDLRSLRISASARVASAVIDRIFASISLCRRRRSITSSASVSFSRVNNVATAHSPRRVDRGIAPPGAYAVGPARVAGAGALVVVVVVVVGFA
eukprot:20671-Pelagococcus_subviridis.AAC.5